MGQDNICPFPVSLSESLISSRSFKDGTATESPRSESAFSGRRSSWLFLEILCWDEEVALSVCRLLSISFIFCATYTFLEGPWPTDIWPLLGSTGRLFGGLWSFKRPGPLAASCVWNGDITWFQILHFLINFPQNGWLISKVKVACLFDVISKSYNCCWKHKGSLLLCDSVNHTHRVGLHCHKWGMGEWV